MPKYYDWDREKNELLKQARGISFEDIVDALESGKLLAVIGHPNKKKYPNQKIYIINIENYAYCVPFVDEGEKRFLKTIFPNRKYTRKYIERKKYERLQTR